MRPTVPALCVAAALTLAACGTSSKTTSTSASNSSGSTSSSAPARTSTQTAPSKGRGTGNAVSVSADPKGALKFNTSQATAKAGKVTLKFTNPASIPHGLSIEGNGLDKEGKVLQMGGSSSLAVNLKPGKYTFYCPVPGHRQAGMQGTLVVR